MERLSRDPKVYIRALRPHFVGVTGNGHMKYVLPEKFCVDPKQRELVTSSSPSDGNAVNNIIRDLKTMCGGEEGVLALIRREPPKIGTSVGDKLKQALQTTPIEVKTKPTPFAARPNLVPAPAKPMENVKLEVIDPFTFSTASINMLKAPKSGNYTITPEFARFVLETTNTRNRTVKSSRVELYAKSMKEGNWKFNAEAIIFGVKDGRLVLMNGQHRLMACVLTGLSFPSALSFGVSEEAFSTMDNGAARTGGDTLNTSDIFPPDMKNRKQIGILVASTINFLRAYCGGNVNNSGRSKVTNEQLLEEYNNFPGLLASVHYVLNKAISKTTFITPSVAAAMHLLGGTWAKKPAETEAFFDRIKRLEFNGPNDPARILYTKLSRMKTDGRAREIGGLCLKALRADLDGRTIAGLVFKEGEELPKF